MVNGGRSRSGSRDRSPGNGAKLLGKVLDDGAWTPPTPKQRDKGNAGGGDPGGPSGSGGNGNGSNNSDDAIRRYTTGSDELNRYLRTTNKSSYSEKDRKRLDKEAADISAALNERPADPGKTWRGAPGGDWVDKVQKGGLYSDPAFMSTSTSESAAQRFKFISTGGFSGNKSNGVIFSVDGKNGRNITDSSSLSHQKEVLFDRGTLFRVKDKTKDGDTTYLDLEELT
ncbi:ADP-ribosyltransferase [Glycomyces sp. NRRL B-16210]|uniref:ADP-ribosyltransferase n=1 Tax=Glycomyces sp. NRRL B-16210 TaxID=1463821 RepID=UPI0004C293DA|nr:ADP-ribosyltransferase [Glycomyces sp. NRRL B-16210]